MRGPGASKRYASAWKMSSPDLVPILSLARPSRSSTGCRCCQMRGSRALSCPGPGIGAACSSSGTRYCRCCSRRVCGRGLHHPVDLEGRGFAAYAYDSDRRAAREMLVPVEQPGDEPIQVVGVPIKMTGTPGGVHRRAPLLGEDTLTR